MKPYLISLAIGLLVGVLYGAFKVRSPAPPVIALVGLLGILVGEQLVPIVKQLITGEGLSIPWLSSHCGEHIFGRLPQGGEPARPDETDSTRPV